MLEDGEMISETLSAVEQNCSGTNDRMCWIRTTRRHELHISTELKAGAKRVRGEGAMGCVGCTEQRRI